MIRRLAFTRRAAGVGYEDFQAHWRGKHAELARLLPNLRDTGFSANLLKFFYYASVSTAWFDDISHIIPAHILALPCAVYATQPSDACNANYTQREARRAKKRRKTRAHRRPAERTPAPAPARQAPQDGGAKQGDEPARKLPDVLPRLPDLPPVKLPPVEAPKEPELKPLLDYLLG